MTTSQKLYDTATKFLGVAEVPGNASNPAIVKFIDEAATWLKDGVKDIDGSIAWCGCFRGHLGIITGTGVPREHYRAAMWQTWGAAVDIKQPKTWKPGDTIVTKRTGGNHVALFSSFDTNTNMVELLGGNQGDKVCYAKFPLSSVISVRRLI